MPGNLHLGTARLNQASIQGIYADELALIGQHLSSTADILFYGCDFGQDTAAINAIAALTGADVAASIDDTGAMQHSVADWVLETAQTGVIESIGHNRLCDYQGILKQQL